MKGKKIIYPRIETYNSEYQLVDKVIFMLQVRDRNMKEIANAITTIDGITDKEKANAIYVNVAHCLWQLEKKGTIVKVPDIKPYAFKLNY